MHGYHVKASWPGRPELKPAEIKALWRQIVNDRVDRVIFYNQAMNEDNFINMVLSDENQFAFIYQQDHPIAFFWLNNFMGQGAMIHFGFFKNGMKEQNRLGPNVLKWCFDGGYKFLIGLLPAFNRPARAYARRCGGQILGRLPGACYIHRRKCYDDGITLIFKPPISKEE